MGIYLTLLEALNEGLSWRHGREEPATKTAENRRNGEAYIHIEPVHL
jgi:hypothetical protein